MTIRVGDNGDGDPRDQVCGSHVGTVPVTGGATITCTTPTIGQFVSVVLNAMDILTLCEVKVEATNASCHGITCI